MTLRDFIPIDLTLPAQIFEIELAGEPYQLGINYNETADSYTVDLYDDVMNPIILGERMIYGLKLWSGIDNPQIPLVDLIPFDESGVENTVSLSNFGKAVYLFIDDVGEVDYGD